MVATYRKGAHAERELVEHFSSMGFSVIRAAGSGVNSLSPDLLLFRQGKQYALECKAHDTLNLSIDKDQFESLQKWEDNTGITALVGWRVNRQGWRFLNLSLFTKNEKSYTIGLEHAWRMGKRLEEL